MTVQEYDVLFRGSPHKDLTLTFSDNTVITNSQIVSESLTLEEALCSDENLYYGACESSCFSIRIAYTNKSFKGLHVGVEATVLGTNFMFGTDDGDVIVDDEGNIISGSGTTTVNLGTYLVVSDVPTNDRQYRDLVCYDKMYEIADLDIVSWYNGLTFPMTLKAFRDSLFTHLNVTQETATLVNDSYSIVGGFSTDELLCRDVLVSICELNGVFGHIDKATGKFLYVDLTAAESLTYPYYVNGTGAYEDYVTDKITGVIAKSAEDEVGTLVGTKTNLYTLMGNLCLYGDEGKPAETTALTNLFNKIKDYQYRPFTVQTYGNPMLPLGTKVEFETTYQTVESFVMKKYLTGIQGMRDTLTATGEKTYPADEARMTSQLTRLKGVSHKLVIDTNRMMSEIYDADTGILSTIDQLSDKVVLKVTSGGRIVQAKLEADPSTGTSFSVKADDIEFIADGAIQLTSKSLAINSTNFQVDPSGKITAKSAKITGDIVTTSLKIDNMAELAVGSVTTTYKAYNWVNGEMAAASMIETQDMLQITNNTIGFKINTDVLVSATLKSSSIQCDNGDIGELYITSNGYFMKMYGHRIELTNSTVNPMLTADIINQAKWDGTNTSLVSALAALSNRITALGG